MNNFIALFKGGMSRSKGILIIAVFASIGIGLLSIVGVNSMVTDISTLKLGFIDRDGSAVSADFARYLEEDLEVELVRSDDVDEMNTLLVDKRISGLIEVPSGFQEALLTGRFDRPAELTFMADYANEVFTRGYIDSYMQSLGVISLAAGGEDAALESLLAGAKANRVLVETLEKDAELFQAQKEKDVYRLMLAAFMMLSFYMTICISTLLFSDRTQGTYRRIKTGRVTSAQYISSVAAIGIMLMAMINVPSLVLYGISGGDPGVPIAATAGLLAAYSLFVVAFGMFAGLVMPGISGIIAMVVATVTITSMLGGAFFPIEMAPAAFQTISRVTPQFWVFETVTSIQNGDGNPLGAVLVILLMAALFFVLSGIHFASNRGMLRTISTRDAA
jgi:ABC-2 type transport system permease protein